MFPNITKLKVAYVSCSSAETLERWFCGLTNLRDFHLILPRCPPDEDEGEEEGQPDDELAFYFLRAFAPPSMRASLSLPPLGVNPVCPQLEELTTSGIGQDFLVRFAAARLADGGQLKSIVHDSRDEMDMKNVRKLEDLGLNVEEYSESEYGVESSDDVDSDLDENSEGSEWE